MQKHEAKRNRRRPKARINLGGAFPRWASLKRDRCFQSDAEVACFLMDSYERDATAQVTAPAVYGTGVSHGIDSEVEMPQIESLQPEHPRELGLVSPISAPATSASVQSCVRKGEVFPGDVQQILVIKEEVPHEWNPSLDKQEPDLQHIKEEQEEQEEQEELSTSQEGNELNGLFEADITRSSFTSVSVKSEDATDDEKCQFLWLKTEDSSSDKQIKTETVGDDYGGSGQWNLEPNSHLQTNTDEKASVSIGGDDEDGLQEPVSDSGPETEDSDSVNSGLGCNVAKKCLSCSECDKQFQCNQSLMKHMTDSPGRRSSCCLVNKKSITVMQNADSEVEVHTEEKSFSCDDCGQRFNRKTNLKTHMRIHTGEKPFLCNVCEKAFGRKYSLDRHMGLHTGEKPFSCDVCGQRFNHNTNLKTHKRIHTGEKPFGCGVCSKRFSQPGDLKRHMSVHTGEKPFVCTLCSKRFSQPWDLKRHMSVHTGEKPFNCGVCGKKFTQRIHYKMHLRVHTGERPFTCNICDKRFKWKIHLKTHMRIHTREKSFGRHMEKKCS